MSKRRWAVWVDWTDWALLRVYVISILGTYCVGLQIGPVCCEVTSGDGVGGMHTLKSLIKTGEQVKILYQVIDGCLPAFRHAHKNDAGYDLYSTEKRLDQIRRNQGDYDKCTGMYSLWIRGYCQLAGAETTARVCFVTLGTIDAGYTGPIWVVLSCLTYHGMHVRQGDRVAQLVILQLPEVELTEGDLPETERGESGLGRYREVVR